MAEESKPAGWRRMRNVRLRPEVLSGDVLAVMTRVMGEELKMDRGQAERYLKKYGLFKGSPA